MNVITHMVHLSLYTHLSVHCSKAYSLPVIEVKGSVTSSCKIRLVVSLSLTSDLSGKQCSSMADCSIPAPSVQSSFPHAGVFFDTRRRNTE